MATNEDLDALRDLGDALRKVTAELVVSAEKVIFHFDKAERFAAEGNALVAEYATECLRKEIEMLRAATAERNELLWPGYAARKAARAKAARAKAE